MPSALQARLWLWQMLREHDPDYADLLLQAAAEAEADIAALLRAKPGNHDERRKRS